MFFDRKKVKRITLKKFKAWEAMQKPVYEETVRRKFGNGSSLAATTIKAARWGENDRTPYSWPVVVSAGV